MEGFINLRLRPWLRRLITRLIAIIPAVIVILLYGERGTGQLLILSQVILSLQLSFAVFPLVMFTSDPHKMGTFANPLWVQGAGVAGRGRDCRAQRVSSVADFRGLTRCTTEFSSPSRTPQADRTILDSRGRPREADRRRAAAGARRRRLGGAQLRPAAAARVGGDASRTAPISTACATIWPRAASPCRRKLAMGDPATELIQDRRGAAGRSDRHVHARPSLSRRRAARHDGRSRAPPGQGAGAAPQSTVVLVRLQPDPTYDPTRSTSPDDSMV